VHFAKVLSYNWDGTVGLVLFHTHNCDNVIVFMES